MQSEFENVGVLPKISGGSRGGLGWLQVPRWNLFFRFFFSTSNQPSTQPPKPHSHPPPLLSVNPRWRRARSASENVRSNLMPFVFFIMSRLFNTLGVKLDPSPPPAGPPPPSNKMKTWTFDILNESECAPPHHHHI